MMPETTQSRTGTHDHPWRVFVGFDDVRARRRASDVCEFITKQFWPDIEFELDLCDFHQLGNAENSNRAITSAAAAKIVIISTSASEESQSGMGLWIDGLRARRHGREGVLVSLVDPVAPEPLRVSAELGLRHLAHELGLDYLTHAPDCRALLAEEKMETVEVRSKNVGPVLEEILAHPTRPTANA
jgi:hypothetical protein